MNNIKNIFLIIVLVLLIGFNLYFEYKNMDFSSDPNDNKLIDTNSKFLLETDDNKYQIIDDCFQNFYNYSNMSDKAPIKSISLTSKPNVFIFSIQEIYKVENEKKSINYVKIYEIINNTLSVDYYSIKLNYEKFNYYISKSNKEEFNNAIKNKIEKNYEFDYDLTQNNDTTSYYNLFKYNNDYTKIARRYLKDYYIKYNFSNSEIRNIIMKNQKSFRIDENELNNIVSLKKQVNENNISYHVYTNNNEYEINVYSPLKYKIGIK